MNQLLLIWIYCQVMLPNRQPTWKKVEKILGAGAATSISLSSGLTKGTLVLPVRPH